MAHLSRPDSDSRWTTRSFALSRSEWVTSAGAAALSASAYLRHGRDYLGPGVAGDLAGFAVLRAVLAREVRLRHEAALCLTCIGGVLAVRQRTLQRLPEPLLWAAFAAALLDYVSARRRVCD